VGSLLAGRVEESFALARSRKGLELFGVSVCTVGALILLAAPSELAYEVVQWLKIGIWPHLRFGDLWFRIGWTRPDIGWNGIQSIVTWVFDWPASLTFIAAGLAISFFGRR
jgi:hypothetical protein